MSRNPQPSRGTVDLLVTPGRLVNRDTGLEIKHAIWADLDAGEYTYIIHDANGLPIPDKSGQYLQYARAQAPLAFEPSTSSQEVVQAPSTPAIVEEAIPPQTWPAPSEDDGDDDFIEDLSETV